MVQDLLGGNHLVETWRFIHWVAYCIYLFPLMRLAFTETLNGGLHLARNHFD